MYPEVPPPQPPPTAPPMLPPPSTHVDSYPGETSNSLENNNIVQHSFPSPPATGLPVNPPRRLPVRWSTGLFNCFDDVGNCDVYCCLTCLCPCVTFGRIAEVVDGGTTSCIGSGALYALIMCLTGCSCLYSCFYRSKLRGQHLLEETPCCDCLVHCCCESCALCQEYRELKNRGLDPRIGWQQRLWYVPPAVEGNMTR